MTAPSVAVCLPVIPVFRPEQNMNLQKVQIWYVEAIRQRHQTSQSACTKCSIMHEEVAMPSSNLMR